MHAQLSKYLCRAGILYNCFQWSFLRTGLKANQLAIRSRSSGLTRTQRASRLQWAPSHRFMATEVSSASVFLSPMGTEEKGRWTLSSASLRGESKVPLFVFVQITTMIDFITSSFWSQILFCSVSSSDQNRIHCDINDFKKEKKSNLTNLINKKNKK